MTLANVLSSSNGSSSNDHTAGTDSGGGGRARGALAYERTLTERECQQLERAQQRLQRLEGYVHLWIRDARGFGHGREGAVEPLSMRLHPTLPVAEVRDLIQEAFEQATSYRHATDGPLQLLYRGRMLETGKLLAEYLLEDGPERKPGSWPRPFGGIIWVVPFRNAPKRTGIWGNGQTMTATATTTNTA